MIKVRITKKQKNEKKLQKEDGKELPISLFFCLTFMNDKVPPIEVFTLKIKRIHNFIHAVHYSILKESPHYASNSERERERESNRSTSNE